MLDFVPFYTLNYIFDGSMTFKPYSVTPYKLCPSQHVCVRTSLLISTLKTKWLFVRKLYIFGLLEFYKYRSRSEQSELVCRIRINNYGRIRVGYLICSGNCHQYVKERHKPWIGKTCFLVNVLKCMLRFLEMFTRRF